MAVKNSSAYRDKRRQISNSLPPKMTEKLSEEYSHLLPAADQKFRHDIFSHILRITGIGIVFGIFLTLIYIGIKQGWYFPAIQSVGDLHLFSDYRDPNASFTTFAMLNDDQLVLGTDGNGIQVYDTNSGINGYWDHFDTNNTSGKLPDNRIRDLTAINNDLLLVSGDQLVASRNDFQNWDSLVGQGDFYDLNPQTDITGALLTEDGQGIFVSTKQNGLGQYDTLRHSWQKIQEASENPLYSDQVNALAFGMGYLWVGTSKGLNVFNLDVAPPHWVTSHQTPLELPDYDIREIHISGGDVWLRSASGGVLFWQDVLQLQAGWVTIVGETGFEALAPEGDRPSSVFINGTTLWVATHENGIGAYDTRLREWKLYSTEDGLSSNEIKSLIPYMDTVWAVTSIGIDSYDPAADQWQERLKSNIAKVKESSGDLWYVTQEGGVGVYRGRNNTWQTLIGDTGIPSADGATIEINSIAVYDQQIWLGLGGVGIGEYDPARHSWQIRNEGLPFAKNPDSRVVEIKTMLDSLWCRIENKPDDALPYVQVYKWDGGTWQPQTPETSSVKSMQEDGENIWFLLEDGSMLNGLTGQAYFTSLDAQSASFTGMARFKDRLYLGESESGIIYYDLTTHTWGALSGLQNNSISDIYSDDTHLWYVTASGGLGAYDLTGRELKEVAQQPENLTNAGDITTIEWYRDQMWIGTSNGRIFRYNPSLHEIYPADLGGDAHTGPFGIAELVAIEDALWCLTDWREANLYKYDANLETWNQSDSDVASITIEQNQVWSLSTQGEARLAAEGTPAYFNRGFQGISTAHKVAVDRSNQLWFISKSDGFGVYSPSNHQWLDTSSISNSIGSANDLLIMPAQEAGTDLALLATSNGIHTLASKLGEVTEEGWELKGKEVEALQLGDNKLWGLARNEDGAQTLWREASGQSDAWVSILGGDLSADVSSSVDQLLYLGNKFWVRNANGSLYSYDVVNHHWERECTRADNVQNIFVVENSLWVFENNSEWGEVYRIADPVDGNCSSFWEYQGSLKDVAQSGGTLWYAGENVLGVKSVSALGTDTLRDDNGKTVFQYKSSGLIRYIPWFYLVLGVIVILVILCIWKTPEEGWQLFEFEIGSVYIWLFWVILGIIIGLYFNYQWLQEQSIAGSIWNSDIKIQELADYKDNTWIATDHGLWRFAYNFKQEDLNLYGYYGQQTGGLPSDVITDLQVVNNKLYAQVEGWRWFGFTTFGLLELGWKEVDELPMEVVEIKKGDWKWDLRGRQLNVEVKDDSGKYQKIAYQNGIFPVEQPQNIVVQQNKLLSMTPNSIALYSLDRKGKLNLNRLYYSGEAGLPVEEIRRCVWWQAVYYCEVGQSVYALKDDRWELSAGVSPFDQQQEIYSDPATGLVINSGLDHIEIDPPALISPEAGFTFDQIDSIYVAAEILWLKTPAGIWQSQVLENGGVSLNTFLPEPNGGGELFKKTDHNIWQPDGEIWTWEKFHDRATGQDRVKITLSQNADVPRRFDPSGKFADQWVGAILSEGSEKTSAGRVWLGAHQGIWLVSIQFPNEIQYLRYYPLNGEDISHFRLSDGLTYAQTSSGGVFVYDPGADEWNSSSVNPFSFTLSIQDEKLGTLAQNHDGQILLQQQNAQLSKFVFDEINDVSTSQGNLWTATSAGILMYKTGNGELDLLRHDSTLDELAGVENITALRWSEQGELFCQATQMNGNVFAVFRDGTWRILPYEETPFAQKRFLVKDVPGMLDWYQEGDEDISAYLDNRLVRFVNGKFDFDFVYDMIATGDDLWALTAGGALRYQNDDTLSIRQISHPPQTLTDIGASQSGIYGRSQTGTVFTWLNQQWRLYTGGMGRDYPFTHKTALVDKDQNWTIKDIPDASSLPLIQAWDIPPNQLFAANGKFSFDFVQDIFSESGRVWLATRGGVFYKKDVLTPWAGLTMPALSGINAESLAYLQDEFLIKSGNGVWALNPLSGWYENPDADVAFTHNQVRYQNGNWSAGQVPQADAPNWIEIQGLENDELFDSNGKFAFDTIHSIASKEDHIWLGTSGGLVSATLNQNGFLSYEELITRENGLINNDARKIRLGQDGNMWLTFIDPHDGNPIYQNPSRVETPVLTDPLSFTKIGYPFYWQSYNFEFKAGEAGSQIWLGNILLQEYPATQKFLGFWGKSFAVEDIVSVTESKGYLWLLMRNTLVRLDKEVLGNQLKTR